jgi:cellulose synthase (UDP-forming)
VKPTVLPDDYPDIDVLIATHNEEASLLLKTVNAALFMKYPDHSKVHIYLSDDTNRLEVKQLAKKFNIGYIGLEGNKHAKSGNLNNALAHSHSPLIATFDADMIPYSDFLLETVPYFIGNAKEREEDERIKPLGFVQTPQSFYNEDVFQYNLFSGNSIPNEQDFFSREVNILYNAQDAAIYTGSNTVLSRQAIVDAGGFPTDTITEDFELGALINSKGYKSISTLEPMASGLTPTDIPSVLKQRVRWGRGVVQSVKNLHLLTNKNLTIQQKLVFLNSYLYWWAFIRRLLYILAPILFTVFSIRVVDTNFWALLIYWLLGYLLLHLAMQDVSSDIRTQSWGEVQETILAPYLFIPVFLQSIGIKEKKFKVTDKKAKQSKKDRIYAIPHAILLALTVIGLVKFNYGKYGSEMFYGSVITFWLLTHLFNLTFSVLFYLGRPIYRKAERFLFEEKVVVSYNEMQYHLMTKNVSETGLSFVSNQPLYFPENIPLNFLVTHKGYQAKLTGKIVRVTKEQNQWVYGVHLDEISEKEYLQYLQIIYDGFNQSLPKYRNPWVTPFDRLIDNIQKRWLSFGTKTTPISKFPMIEINEIVQLNGKDVLLKSFNYQTVIFSSTQNLAKKQEDKIVINQVDFELAFNYQNGRDCIYTVKNLSEIVDTSEFKQLINQWVKEERVIDDSYATY